MCVCWVKFHGDLRLKHELMCVSGVRMVRKGLNRLHVLRPEGFVSQDADESHSDRIYLHAAAVFQNTQLDKPAAHRLISYGQRSEVSVPVVRDELSQRLAYRLAFSALKYQQLVEDILIDSCFCVSQPMSDDWMSLVAVMLTDLLDRKFLPRIQTANQKRVQEVREVEACLLRFKIKLIASVARCRIKHDLLTLDNILPDDIIHKHDKAPHLPLYTWVNTLRTSMEEVCGVLHTSGFSCVECVRQLKGQSFCKDAHCHDLLVFPNTMKTQLVHTGLLTDYKLIIQDKWCCVGPWALRSLLVEGGDVLIAGCLSAQTIGHVSAVAASAHTHTHTDAHRHHRHNTVFVCLGDQTLTHRDEIQRTLQTLSCKNVNLLSDSLHTLDVSDVRLQKVHVILLMPLSSLSALSNPVDFILQEDAASDVVASGLMLGLCQGSVSPDKLQSLTCQQRRDLQRALIFPKVCAVLYSTCSVYSEENEELLNRVLRESQHNDSTAPPYRLCDPGLLQVSVIEESEDMKMNLFRLEASGDSNGCFLALLTRQPEAEATETPHDVLARAAAKGLLHDVLPNQPIKRQGCGRRSRRAPVKQRRSKQSRPHASQSDQSRLEEFLQREMRRDSHLNTSGSSNPSQNNSAGSQRRAQGVSSRTGPAPSPASSPASFSSSSQRSLKRPGVASVSTIDHLSSVTPLKGRKEVLRPATITFPPVIFPKNVPPSVRRSHALPALRSDPGHTYLQCSIGPRPATLPQTCGLFRASLHVQRKQ